MEWKEDYAACQHAEVALRTQAAECSSAEGTLAQRAQRCGISTAWSPSRVLGKLDLELGAPCMRVVLHLLYAVREAGAAVVRWRKSWLSTARMECMAKVIDGSGAVDLAKMHACNGKNIADLSFLNFTIDKLPSKAACPTPEIYPGSTLYREEIYGQLPAGLSVRPPTPCPCSIRSTVDLNKLHFDVSKPRSTDVRVKWSSACGWPVVVCVRMARGRLRMARGSQNGSSTDGPWSSTDGRGSKWSSACGWPVVVRLRMARGRPPADGPRSSACGWPVVVRLRMARGRPAADGPWSSACGWPVVVRLRMARGRPPADGPWSSACGWPVVVRLRMARGRPPADGPWSSACGWPVVVRLRMARGRPPADGPWSSACGWPKVVCLQMAQGLAVPLSRRRKVGRVSTPPGWPLAPWSCGRVVALVLPTTTAFHSALLHKKMSVRGWGRWAGTRARARMHCCVVFGSLV